LHDEQDTTSSTGTVGCRRADVAALRLGRWDIEPLPT
jgi:hypothetical protein